MNIRKQDYTMLVRREKLLRDVLVHLLRHYGIESVKISREELEQSDNKQAPIYISDGGPEIIIELI